MGKLRDSAAPSSPNGSGSDDEVTDFGSDEPSEDEETIAEHEELNEEESCKGEPDQVVYEEEVIEEETCEEELDDKHEQGLTVEEKCEEEPIEEVCREEANEEETSEQKPNEEEACVEEQTDEHNCEEEPKEEEACEEEQTEEQNCEEEPNEEEACEEVQTEEKTSVEEPNEEDTCEEEPTEVETNKEEEPTEEEIVEEPHVEHPSEASADHSPSESDTDEEQHPNSTPILPEEKKRSADALEHHFQKRHKQEIDSELKSCAGSFLSDSVIASDSKDEIASKKIVNSGSSGKRRRTRYDADHEVDGEESDTGDAAKKKRKTGWENDDAFLKMLGPLKLPDFDKDLVDDAELDPEIKKLNSELLEVSRKLQAQEFPDDLPVAERSPSPPPIYNEFGVRLNTREARYHVKLVERRQKIISDLVQKYPTFKPPSDCRPSKLYKKLYIPVKEYPEYNFIGLIIGPRGNTQKKMEKETGARILIRGKGSLKDERLGKDPNPDLFSDYEDLHVRVEAESESSLDAAVKMVEKLLVPVEDGLNVLKHAQLRELAKLRAEDLERIPKKGCEVHVSCSICGNFDHLTYACPLRASTLISNNGGQSKYLAEIGAGGMSPFSGPPVYSSVMPVPWMASSSSAKHGGKTCNEIDENNLFVGFLPQTVNDTRLIDLFSPFGSICSACVIKDKTTGLSKGYGFVRYNNPESASKAIAQMNGYKIDGKMLAVRIKGLPPSAGNTNKEQGAVPGFTHLPACPGPQAIARLNPDPVVWPGPPGALLPEANPSRPSLVHIKPIGGQPPASFGYTGQSLNFPSLVASGCASASELTQFSGNLRSLDLEDHLAQPTPFTSLSSQLDRSTQVYGVRHSFMHSHGKLPF